MTHKAHRPKDDRLPLGYDGSQFNYISVDDTGRQVVKNQVVDPDTMEWVNQQSSGTGAPSGDVAVTNWPADQAVSGPLTDTELRATAVPVSGTFWPGSQPVSGPLTDTELRATDVKVSLDGESVSVTGAFYPATQPVSASALPLPDGAATATNQQGFIERSALNSLKRISTDASGRLRVSAESVASHAVTLTTLTTLTNLTNWGLSTATGKSQWESHAQYQAGYRRNLVHS